MKRYIPSIAFLLMAIALGFPHRATGAELRLIHVAYEFSGEVQSFRLYQDGSQVCESFDTTTSYIACTVFLTDAPMTFTMTAVNPAGVESAPSPPYILQLPPTDSFGNFIPTASFTVDVPTGPAPLYVSHDASASKDIDGNIISYDWDFGDGGIGSGAIVPHLFDPAGIYIVTLVVTDDSSAAASTFQTVTATQTDPPPSANIAPTAVITANQLASTSIIAFDAFASSDPDGTISSYSWDFGDGATAAGPSIEHEYIATGEYTITLTVIDNEGLSAQDQLILSIIDLPTTQNELPVALITASVKKQLFHFEWDYRDSTGMTGFTFYQNNRKACQSVEPQDRQLDCTIFLEEGLTELYLTATALDGTESEISNIFAFNSTGLVPTTTGGPAPFAIQFSASLSYDPDGTINAYSWDFGDGTVATGPLAFHTFTSAGIYTITLIVTDNLGEAATSTTTVSVTEAVSLNTPPVANNQTIEVTQDTVVIDALSGSDPDGDALTYSMISNGTLGFALITNTVTGTFKYTPNSNATGTDFFTFKVNDGTADSNMATVTITITPANHPPTANNAQFSTSEDTPLSAALNATDPDGDSLLYSLATPPSKGIVVIQDNATGTFSYAPNPNEYGTDSFTFTVNDGLLDSAPASVAIAINAVNDPPEAKNSTITTQEDTPVNGTLTATDVDNDTLTFSISTNGVLGTAVITNQSTGAFTYRPSANNFGMDGFAFQVNDGKLNSALGVVTVDIIPVNDAPAATPDAATTIANTQITIDVLANDIDAEDNLSITAVSQPANGTAAIFENTVLYTPISGFFGTDSFTYILDDNSGATATGSVTVTVIPATEPQTKLTVTWEYNALAKDISGFKLYSEGISVCETSDPASRELTCLIPATDRPLSIFLTSVASDGSESLSSNTLTYTVQAPPAGHDVTFFWDYNEKSTTLIGSFRMYINGAFACDSKDPLSRKLTCQVPGFSTPATFTITTTDLKGTESSFSNEINYAP